LGIPVSTIRHSFSLCFVIVEYLPLQYFSLGVFEWVYFDFSLSKRQKILLGFLKLNLASNFLEFADKI